MSAVGNLSAAEEEARDPYTCVRIGGLAAKHRDPENLIQDFFRHSKGFLPDTVKITREKTKYGATVIACVLFESEEACTRAVDNLKCESIANRWVNLYPMRLSDYKLFGQYEKKATPMIRHLKKNNANLAVKLCRLNDSITVYDILKIFQSKKFSYLNTSDVIIDIKNTSQTSFRADNALVFMKNP